MEPKINSKSVKVGFVSVGLLFILLVIGICILIVNGLPAISEEKVYEQIVEQVQPQIEAEWEIFTEVKNNTVFGDGVKIQHKRCSNCKQPMGLAEEFFCGKCGAKMKGANNNGR